MDEEKKKKLETELLERTQRSYQSTSDKISELILQNFQEILDGADPLTRKDLEPLQKQQQKFMIKVAKEIVKEANSLFNGTQYKLTTTKTKKTARVWMLEREVSKFLGTTFDFWKFVWNHRVKKEDVLELYEKRNDLPFRKWRNAKGEPKQSFFCLYRPPRIENLMEYFNLSRPGVFYHRRKLMEIGGMRELVHHGKIESGIYAIGYMHKNPRTGLFEDRPFLTEKLVREAMKRGHKL